MIRAAVRTANSVDWQPTAARLEFISTPSVACAVNGTREAAMLKRLLEGVPAIGAVLWQVHELRNELAAACPLCRLEITAPEWLDKINSKQIRPILARFCSAYVARLHFGDSTVVFAAL